MTDHFTSACTKGESCGYIDEGEKCGRVAQHKVEETIFHDDPIQQRHPYTNYLCCAHYSRVMGMTPKPCNTDEVHVVDYARMASTFSTRLIVSTRENVQMEALLYNLVASASLGSIERLKQEVHNIELYLKDNLDEKKQA